MTGTLVKTIEDPARFTNGRFGEALEQLGTDVVVGAPSHNAGRVYRIDADTVRWGTSTFRPWSWATIALAAHSP